MTFVLAQVSDTHLGAGTQLFRFSVSDAEP